MLKAVRFDLVEHKELLEFIENFTDSKGRKNESEAIRYLMKLGLESLKNKNQSAAPQIDIDKIKQEILSQIMNQLPSIIQQPPQPVQPIYQKPIIQQQTEKPKEIKNNIEQKPKQQKQSQNLNPLLTNLLSNINK